MDLTVQIMKFEPNWTHDTYNAYFKGLAFSPKQNTKKIEMIHISDNISRVQTYSKHKFQT